MLIYQKVKIVTIYNYIILSYIIHRFTVRISMYVDFVKFQI